MKIAFGLVMAGLLFAGPALAGDCIYMGQPSSEGARICQVGVLAVCIAHAWVPTAQRCAPPTVAPPQISVEAPSQREALALHILSAGYSSGNDGTDVTDAVRALCEEKKSCGFTADDAIMGGKPMPRMPGHLSVMYECSNGIHSEDHHGVFPGRSAVTLTCRK